MEFVHDIRFDAMICKPKTKCAVAGFDEKAAIPIRHIVIRVGKAIRSV